MRVMQKLVEAPHHAVTAQDMQLVLGDAAHEVLHSLCRHRVLHARDGTSLRGKEKVDVPSHPLGRTMFTALNPALHFAMTRLIDKCTS